MDGEARQQTLKTFPLQIFKAKPLNLFCQKRVNHCLKNIKILIMTFYLINWYEQR